MTEESITHLLTPGVVLLGRWYISRLIGRGGFGEIYEAEDARLNESVALKLESIEQHSQILRTEVAVLRRLQESSHVCRFISCGHAANFNFIAMSLQGKNLAELRRSIPHGTFSTSTTLRLLLQIVDCIRNIHQQGFLHRDIKPSNFAMGCRPETQGNVFMLDFGLARKFINAEGKMRPARQVAGFRGTVRYASVNAHLNCDLGRHDDLWSMFYMAVEFRAGELPWRQLRDRHQVGEMKQNYNQHQFLRHFPFEFGGILGHIESLDYYTEPNYALLSNLLWQSMQRLGVAENEPFDWEEVHRPNPFMKECNPILSPQQQLLQQQQRLQATHERGQLMGGGGGNNNVPITGAAPTGASCGVMVEPSRDVLHSPGELYQRNLNRSSISLEVSWHQPMQSIGTIRSSSHSAVQSVMMSHGINTSDVQKKTDQGEITADWAPGRSTQFSTGQVGSNTGPNEPPSHLCNVHEEGCWVLALSNFYTTPSGTCAMAVHPEGGGGSNYETSDATQVNVTYNWSEYEEEKQEKQQQCDCDHEEEIHSKEDAAGSLNKSHGGSTDGNATTGMAMMPQSCKDKMPEIHVVESRELHACLGASNNPENDSPSDMTPMHEQRNSNNVVMALRMGFIESRTFLLCSTAFLNHFSLFQVEFEDK